ncbi:XRE family transcriptional regulator, partial [Butyricicoccus sp. 1XD8-22]
MIGQYIKQLRKQKAYSLVQLSELSGVSNSYLSQIENGKFIPSVEVLDKLHKPLEVDLVSLLRLAGYETVLDSISSKSSVKNNEFIKLIDLMELLNKDSSIYQLENLEVCYNGHFLSDEDRQRILTLLDT